MLSQLTGWFGGDAGRVWFTRVLLPVLGYGFLVATALDLRHAPDLEGLRAELDRWLGFLQGDVPFAAAALLGVGLVVSALVLEALDLPLTRLLEGYWPDWPVLSWSRECHRFSQWCDRRAMLRRLVELELAMSERTLEPAEFSEREWLDVALERYPEQEALTMPTRFGNALRAAEQKIEARYGLNAVILWSRLWLVLPEPVKAELGAARSRMALLVRIWWLALLLLPWAYLAWWLAPVGLIGMAFAYRRLLYAAGTYGDLFVAANELHRFDLYRALRWPLPRSTAEEMTLGQALTRHVWRGADPRAAVRFQDGG
jgi:hypothetical protein